MRVLLVVVLVGGLGCGKLRGEQDCLSAAAGVTPAALQGSVAWNGTAWNGTAFNGTAWNGVAWNGAAWNGTAWNGVAWNGQNMNGTAWNGVTLAGRAVQQLGLNGISLRAVQLKAASGSVCGSSVTVQGSELRAKLPNGSEVTGQALMGAELAAISGAGPTARVRLDAVETKGDLHFYAASLKTDQGWKPLCGTDAQGAPVKAIALRGTWDMVPGTPTGGAHVADEAKFTFACRGVALAKCVELGYAPWKSHAGASLADHHKACVRMVRADFCGDGVSYTEDGTKINLYDGVGVQQDTETWNVEAEWDTKGARCVKAGNFRRHKPACYDRLVNESCGDPAHFKQGALLMTEIPPRS